LRRIRRFGGDLADEIATLRRQPGGEIIAWGGANFAQSLSRAGLVDEYVLVIQPVAFGSGLPLFADLPDALRLELIEAKTFDSTVLHIYEPSDRATRPRTRAPTAPPAAHSGRCGGRHAAERIIQHIMAAECLA
jgi:RibD C-terminal domain